MKQDMDLILVNTKTVIYAVVFIITCNHGEQREGQIVSGLHKCT